MDIEMSTDAEKAWLESWGVGPRRVRWTRLPLQVGDAAPSVTLKAIDGADFAVRDAWKDRPAVLIFLRHFGCSCASDRAERLKTEISRLTAAGASVIAIGQGDASRSQRFVQRTGLPCPLLCDPRRSAYEAYDLLEARPSQVVYGMPESFLRRDPQVGRDFLQSRTGTDRAVVDSPWQLPGEFVVDRNGVIKLAYRSQFCADYADPDVLIAAVREAILGL
jgi:peroxiredoxin